MSVEIEMDRNCWFRSIPYLICGDQSCHPLLRNDITKFMAEKVPGAVQKFAYGNKKKDYFRDWKMPNEGE